ncbi:efflux RND transporter periplasmic adaptor subunit [bacterium]|nr:efflux RND transporter periplasmic adaptor subunit [bacterium]
MIVGLLMLTVGIGIGFSLKGGRTSSGGHEDAAETIGESANAPAEMKTLYTCGMHPEVISEEPGFCPKCDMRLTPMDKDRTRMILEARGEAVPESGGGSAADGEREILYWRAPMDPTYIRNEPGKSPMGMDLVPVYADEAQGGPTIRIDPVTEQNMGLRYDVVRLGPLSKTVRTVGTIEYDENSQGTITTKIDGWVEKVHVNETGAQVHKGDPLFEIYSPELFSAQEEYLTARRDVERSASGTARELAQARLRSARERLKLFDISEAQIERLDEAGELSRTMTIDAGLTGIVTHKNVQEGEMLKAGQPAYRIADLSTVWVIGKVYESDLPFIKLGQEARMTLDYLPGRTWRGRVTYIYPYLEQGTREVPVRMEFHNPGYELKPGMYATIQLENDLDRQSVLVPAMAVIDTGERQVAFVAREPGKFEPRRIKTGVRNNQDELQVLEGLAPGEQVVVSGQFLLDSESRLREATLKMLQPGMQNTSDVLEKGAEAQQYGTATAADASQVASKWVCPMPSHAGILFDQPGDCPLCGMKLVPVEDQDDAQAKQIDHWTCPMPEHYHVQADGPGKCPECDMTMIPVTKGDMQRFEKSVVAAGEMPKQLYTCPMPSHAHVVSGEAGRCPECGMKLVPTEAVPHGKQAEVQWHADHPTTATDAVDGATTATTATTIDTHTEMKSELYVCPMESHKHIVSDEPGRCPECNMQMVPTSEVPFGAESEALWRADHPTTGAQTSR